MIMIIMIDVYIYIYIYIHTYVHIYIYIYRKHIFWAGSWSHIRHADPGGRGHGFVCLFMHLFYDYMMICYIRLV